MTRCDFGLTEKLWWSLLYWPATASVKSLKREKKIEEKCINILGCREENVKNRGRFMHILFRKLLLSFRSFVIMNFEEKSPCVSAYWCVQVLYHRMRRTKEPKNTTKCSESIKMCAATSIRQYHACFYHRFTCFVKWERTNKSGKPAPDLLYCFKVFDFPFGLCVSQW